MTTLEQIQTDLDAITVDQIARAVSILRPPQIGEPVIGIVVSEHTQRLWALAFEYDRRSRKLTYDAMYDEAYSADARAVALAQTVHLNALAEVTRDLAWIDVKQEINAWEEEAIGMRANYAIVSMKAAEAPQATAAAIKVPHNIGAMLAKIFAGLGEPEAEPDISDDDTPARRRRPHRKPQ